MTKYIVERLINLIPVLIGISVAVFLVMRVVPGDPAIAMLGEQADPERLAEVRKTLGLDQPLLVQYFRYMGHALVGNLGRSALTNVPVTQELITRFPATVELTFASIAIGLLVGLPAGVLAAMRRGSTLDALTMSVSLVGVSMPIFWLGLVLIWIFALTFGWLPVSGRLSSSIRLESITHSTIIDSLLAGNFLALRDALRHLVLPAVTLATIPAASIARMTRSSMLEVLGEDYLRTARAKGLPEFAIIIRHALRNAAIPVITLLGLQVGILLGGAVVTETIFSWPGVGRFVLDGVLGRDYAVVQGAVLVITVLYALVNLAVDVSYAMFDPRIRVR
jgi:peptide/nickel transport system permease protein